MNDVKLPDEGAVVTPVPSDEKMVYEIVDTAHPEHNQVLDATKGPGQEISVEELKQMQVAKKIEQLRRTYIAMRLAKRTRERTRSLTARVKTHRKKNTLAKVSRKKNRG